MPVVKPKSIHKTPKRLIAYILNPDKNEKMRLATGLCCHADAKTAYEEFKDVFENFSRSGFHNTPLGGEQKENILMFHYVQSFKPGECTPELAHRIGVEWAKRVFGDKRPVLISTHNDHKHIHNHFAVSVYDYNGKRWYENKGSLERCRKISDKLAIEYGLSVIEKPRYNSNQRYGEWLHRKKGDSWKVKLATDIDRLVMDSSVNSVDDLVDKLKAKGYEVRRRKYISIRAPRAKHFVRSFRLGDGYSLEALIYRVANKDSIMTDRELSVYKGIQFKYALCLREIQMMVYRKKENTLSATYNDLVRSADLLCFLVNHHISDEKQFRDVVSSADEKYKEHISRIEDIQRRCAFEEKLIGDSKRFLELWHIDERTPEQTEEMEKYRVLIDYGVYKPGEVERHRGKLKKLLEDLAVITADEDKIKAERKAAADNYRYYLEQMQGDFALILADSTQRQKKRPDIHQDRRDIEEAGIRSEEENRERRRRNTEAR